MVQTELGHFCYNHAYLLLDGRAFVYCTEVCTVYSLSLWTSQIGKKRPQNAEIFKNQKVTNVPETSIGRCKLKGRWERVVWRFKEMLAIFKTLTCPFLELEK